MLHHLFLFAVFFILGAVFALIFDAFRVSERFGLSSVIIFVLKDLLFWLIVTVLMFVVCLKVNNGEIRMFMFFGVFSGALVYFNTISRFVMNLLYFIVNVFKNAVCFILNVLLFPVKILIKLINKPVFIALSFSKKNIVEFFKKISFRIKVLKKFKR